MNNNSQPVFSIPFNKVEDFSQDSICFRDPKACTRSPNLRFEGSESGEDKMHVFGRFLMHHSYVIEKASGGRFVEITNDNNEIHRTGNVVPGAMTVSKILLPLEILVPELEISKVNFKFTNTSAYDEKTKNVFSFQFLDSENVQVEVNTYQAQKTVARATITGRINLDRAKTSIIKEEDVCEKNLDMVREFFDTLSVESEAYIQKNGYRDYTYPLSYIAVLPSAAIVKQMEGSGGMLNVLKMDFGSFKMIPITNEKGPEVKLERTRERATFNKIITEIANGFATYYRGLAIVNPVAGFRKSTSSVISSAK